MTLAPPAARERRGDEQQIRDPNHGRSSAKTRPESDAYLAAPDSARATIARGVRRIGGSGCPCAKFLQMRRDPAQHVRWRLALLAACGNGVQNDPGGAAGGGDGGAAGHGGGGTGATSCDDLAPPHGQVS